MQVISDHQADTCPVTLMVSITCSMRIQPHIKAPIYLLHREAESRAMFSHCADYESLPRFFFFSFSFFFFSFWFFETGFLCVALAVLELWSPGWPQTQKSACLSLPSDEIKGVHYHARTQVFISIESKV